MCTLYVYLLATEVADMIATMRYIQRRFEYVLMKHGYMSFLFLTLLTIIPAHGRVYAQTNVDSLIPLFEFGLHDVGRYTWFAGNSGGVDGGLDQIGSLWVGAIVDNDTLVALSADGWTFTRSFSPRSEFFQDLHNERLKETGLGDLPGGDFVHAKSEQDIIATYYGSHNGSFTDPLSGAVERQLDIKVVQRSYAWSVPVAEDFILVDYSITNIGLKTMHDVYLGFFFDGDDGTADTVRGDVHGFLRNVKRYLPGNPECEFREDIDVPWYADVDGGFSNIQTGEFDSTGRNHVFSVAILNPPEESQRHSFNWWVTNGDKSKDFGPRKAETRGLPFRDFGGTTGTPNNEGNKYFQMSDWETDYDQLTTALDHTSEGWLPPPVNATDYADGRYDTHALVSTGPFELGIGQTVSFTIALVMADNFHRYPGNFNDNYDPYDTSRFYANLDFSDLVKNVTWAKWVYDNPGVDTDSNGYRGQYVICPVERGVVIDTSYSIDSMMSPPESTLVVDTSEALLRADTFWVTGDGVPDFSAVAPPERPDVRFTATESRIALEWNGLRSETTPDRATRELDFEGYRVYWGLTRRRDDLRIVSSYDIEDYTQWYFNTKDAPVFSDGFWEVIRKPFTLREAQLAYGKGSSDWTPLVNGIDNPLRANDSLFYFTPQDWNQGDLRDTTQIHKIYPDAPYPHTLILDSAFQSDTLYTDPLTGRTTFYKGGELTPDGKRFKYFEYRYIFNNVLASQVYFISVTAFDYGIPGSDLHYLESSRVLTAVEALAQNSVDASLPDGLHVIAYPNPYRINGNYRAQGFEGRGMEDFRDERVRAVHFTGLPPVCTISIYSLDGDLIRQVIHNKAPDDPSAMHDVWDVVSRNLLPVVSGIYYFVVETPTGETQIGKIVLIM